MKNNVDFRKRVDHSLSALTWDARDREAVLRAIDKEEKPVKRKMFSTALVAAIIACLGVSALAVAGWIFSPRVEATRAADAALEAKYGVTREMQSYFDRSEETLPDGATVVTYQGAGEFAYVLGTYTATVQGSDAEVTWSRDGEDTDGGFDADAWGAEQLAVMVEESKAARDGLGHADEAQEIAAAHGVESFNYGHLDPDSLSGGAVDAKALEHLIDLAKDAIREVYGLTDDQLDRLSYVEELSGFLPAGDAERTLYNVDLQLWQDQNPNDVGFTKYMEKDGMYDVAIDVQTDVIESVHYDAALMGQG